MFGTLCSGVSIGLVSSSKCASLLAAVARRSAWRCAGAEADEAVDGEVLRQVCPAERSSVATTGATCTCTGAWVRALVWALVCALVCSLTQWEVCTAALCVANLNSDELWSRVRDVCGAS